jgi:two-component system, cell cycle sensor histidine kinase and response regulator CckA
VNERPPQRPGPAIAKQAQVVLVDDDPGVRAVVAEMLRASGYLVEAPDHPGAIAAVIAEHGCDVLVTDLVMPDASGSEIARDVRRRFPDACVLIMSGYRDDAVDPELLLDPLVGFIQKPFTLDGLLDAIGALKPT